MSEQRNESSAATTLRWLSNALCAVGLVVAVVALLPLAAFFWLIDGEVE